MYYIMVNLFKIHLEKVKFRISSRKTAQLGHKNLNHATVPTSCNIPSFGYNHSLLLSVHDLFSANLLLSEQMIIHCT